jgi:hypothetical protein
MFILKVSKYAGLIEGLNEEDSETYLIELFNIFSIAKLSL